MNEELKTLGQMFQDRRKELNLSLKEIESATSIRSNYLRAIEEGDMSKLISPIYARGFSQQYASFLGLDGDRIVTEHADLFKTPISQEFSYGIGTLEVRNHPGSHVKWLPNALWMGAFFLLLVGAYYLARMLEVV